MNREKRIAEDLREGSYRAFTSFYEEHLPRLYGFVFDALKSRSLASDLVQEAFLKVWENRCALNPELSLKSYLFTIANNLIVTEYRKQINRPELIPYTEFIHETSHSENTTQRQLDFDEFVIQLEKAKRGLTPRQREIFTLIKECGRTSQQVAHQLGITDQVVRNQLSAAIKTLKRELADYLPFFLLFFT